MAQINPNICLRIGAKNDTSKHINQNNASGDIIAAALTPAFCLISWSTELLYSGFHAAKASI